MGNLLDYDKCLACQQGVCLAVSSSRAVCANQMEIMHKVINCLGKKEKWGGKKRKQKKHPEPEYWERGTLGVINYTFCGAREGRGGRQSLSGYIYIIIIMIIKYIKINLRT